MEEVTDKQYKGK